MGAKKKKKAAKSRSGQGVVTTKGKPGAKSVVVKAPTSKKKKGKKRAQKPKLGAPLRKDMAVPTIAAPNDKPIVVMEPPPDKS